MRKESNIERCASSRVLNNEEVFKTARLWERYEKPFRKRGRLCYEKYANDDALRRLHADESLV